MPFVFNDPQHWLDRAVEAREIAFRMTDKGAQADMLAIAQDYERIAARAAERLKHGALAKAGEKLPPQSN